MQKSNALSQAYNRFRAIMFATVVFSFFANILLFVGPLYMLQVYDRVLASRNETTLVMITVIAVGLLLIYGMLEFVRARMLVRAGMEFDEALANPLFDRVVRVQLVNPAAGGRNALSDADKVRDFITGQGILSFFDAPWTPVFLFLCFAFHFWIGVVSTVGAIVIFAMALLNEVLTRKALQDANNAALVSGNFAAAALQNADVIRAMGMTVPLFDRWMAQRDRMMEGQAKASDRSGVILSGSKFVRMALQVAILGTGAYLAIQEEVSPGIIVAASIIMGRALSPVEQAIGQWRQFVGARQANDRLKSLFESVPDEERRTRLPAAKGDLQVEAVTAFVPGTRDTLLKSISFRVTHGAVLAVIGPSGSGKSTLARHLVGVASPAVGNVRLDGVDLRHWDPQQLGEQIGYLPQEIRLFSGTVRDNIARFRPDVRDEDVIAAAKLAGAHEMIAGLRNGYETQIGDNGAQLSGGQRQRVGLARAVFGLPSLIVLDEPNSNLDSAGEQALNHCLQHLRQNGRTVIVITHKANLLSLSDQVLVLSEGAVQLLAPPGELLRVQEAQRPPQVQPVPLKAMPTADDQMAPSGTV